jgi:type II secretory pathway pseudopilin PulG
MNARCLHRIGGCAPLRNGRGFTLIEFAVVAGLVALLISALVVPLATQTRERRVAQALRTLDEIRQALVGYAEAEQLGPRLPCPDTTVALGEGTPNDGIEDRKAADGNCVAYDGNVPWVTLGVAASDPWGTRYRYAVSPAFADRNGAPTPTTAITLTSSGSLWICSGTPADLTASACAPGAPVTEMPPAPVAAPIAPAPGHWSHVNAVAAVILSHGANTWGGISSVTNLQLAPPGGTAARPDESENAGLDARIFVAREPSDAGTARGEFDDIMTWISPHILKSRLVAAGRLP